MEQDYCFLYDRSEEQRVAFEVWVNGYNKNSKQLTNTYLTNKGYSYATKPDHIQLLTHTDWLNRIRPLQVGDVVEVLEDYEWEGWTPTMSDHVAFKYTVSRVNSKGRCTLKPQYFLFRPHRLRLISRAEKPTEWQPKWGEEVEVSDDGKYWLKEVYVGKHPDEEYIMPHVVWIKTDDIIVSYKHIRPIPKPKTLREEIAELPESLSKETILAIIDRYEKGGEG